MPVQLLDPLPRYRSSDYWDACDAMAHEYGPLGVFTLIAAVHTEQADETAAEPNECASAASEEPKPTNESAARAC